MIETTNGVTRIREPYEYKMGVRIERVSDRFMTPECAEKVRFLGLRKVGVDSWARCTIYAHYPMGYAWYKVAHFLLREYRRVIWLLMKSRMFQVPLGDRFSWRYFTPYVWVRGLNVKRSN